MIERIGHILAIQDGQATIRVERSTGCTACGSRGTCGAGQAGSTTLILPVAESARPGEVVTLSIAEASLLRNAILVYLLPALTTLLGAISLAGGGDLMAIGGAASGLALGLAILRLIHCGQSRPIPEILLTSSPRASIGYPTEIFHDTRHP
ncbi:MAG: SoxR reducing system RseC family protein [Pseudomonadota bacterium]